MIVFPITAMILVLFFVNMICVNHLNEDNMIENVWLRRLMIIPPLGILSSILLVLVILFIFAIESIKKLW